MEEHTLDFIVRILFSGMMLFIPNSDGTQLDVVLLNVGHSHQVSDGTTNSDHKAIVVVRGGSCSGTCPRRDGEIAAWCFADLTGAAALDALEAATSGGGAWLLNGSQLSLAKASTSAPDLPALEFQDDNGTAIIPTTSAERAGYRWLADLKEICPACGLNASVLDAQPPSGLVAARFRLNSGNVFTYSVARIGSNVKPVHFKRLDGTGDASSYSQAVATMIGVDIAVSGDSIKLIESKFDGSTGRSMTLTPDANDRVEIAVLNLPPLVPSFPSATPGVGKHFERYYDATQTPPSAAARLVPQPGAAPGAPSYPQVTWQSVHPQETLWSELLNALRMNVSRSSYDVTLCPPAEP
jgi:hypothetical protein